ncbi:MAG: ABC transporter substrate-binding protein [Pseudomonadota bacterium]
MIPLRRRLLAAGLSLPFAPLLGCTRPEPLIRVAGIVWIGYEPLFLARELGYFDDSRLRLVETPSNTASLTALASGDVEAATLTLDECLIAREGGLDVRAILVFDDSAGADVIMAQPDIRDLGDLRGKRIGVEATAAGALMLSKLLEAARLRPEEVRKVPLIAANHVAAYQAREVDALVSFEPFATQLAGVGARRLLDSRRFPGLIVDVLAARGEALERAPEQFAHLTRGYFRALDHLQRGGGDAAARMAPRMGITPAEVTEALNGVRMMDRAANHAWLGGEPPLLVGTADMVAEVMQREALLRTRPNLERLADPRFLPAGANGETV